MDYKNWKILKAEYEEYKAEYAEVANWCNSNGYHIKTTKKYYMVAKNADMPEPTLEEKVRNLEIQYNMYRWQREGILAEGSLYSEYAKAKAQEIEDLAKKLR